MSLSGFSIKRVLHVPAGGGTVSLTGGGSSHYDPGVLVHSGITFHPDGQVYDLGPGSLARTIIVSGEWWSEEPDTGIGSSYDVRHTTETGTGWDLQGSTINVWVQISAERIWRNTVAAMASPATESTQSNFEVRDTGSGSALDNGTYSSYAQN